jgi:KaiC/GvpD/RAD55 family RecA-like ATPase
MGKTGGRTVGRAFDSKFELDILVYASQNPSYRKRAKRILEGFPLTDTRNEWLWNVIKQLGPDDILTPRVALSDIRRLKEDDRDEYREFVRDTLGRVVDAPGVALERLVIYRDAEVIRGSMEQALADLDQDELNSDDIRKARAHLREGIRSNDVNSYRYTDYYEDFPERQKERQFLKEHPELNIRIPTGFMPTLDKDLDGGIGPAEVGLIVATTSRGKSSLAMAIALNSAKRKFETVFIGTEMREKANATRADAHIFDVDFKTFQNFGFSPDDIERIEVIYKRHTELRKRLRIASTSVRGCKASVVEEIIDHAEDDWGEKVKLLVMDSGDHMRPTERYQDRRNRESEAYWELKSIGDERDVAVWSTSHAPKEVVNKIATAENAGESYDKSRISDVFISANANERQRIEGILAMRNAKNRRGQTGSTFFLQATFGRTQFVEVSAEPDTDPDEDDDPKEDGDEE